MAVSAERRTDVPSAASGSAIGSRRPSSAGPYSQVNIISVDPHFLEGNATSHKWSFSAVAELVDNARDAGATQCSIQIDDLEGMLTLIMMDTGRGMEQKTLQRAFGLGHHMANTKLEYKSIGWAGIGLKTASMHLGKDLIVFTKTRDMQTIGLLSRTFLEDAGLSDIRVPLVSWDLNGHPLDASEAATEQSMAAITKYSPYKNNQQCLDQLDYIEDTGTIIMITNLHTTHDGRLKLDHQTDERDILLAPGDAEAARMEDEPRTVDNSLRRYLSLLYRDPTMQIFVAGNRVRTRRILGDLKDKITYQYRPNEMPADYDGPRTVEIHIGFYQDEDLQHTFSSLLYWRGRLIEPFHPYGTKVHFREDGTVDERRAVAVVDCSWMRTTHNKQGFGDEPVIRKLHTNIEKCLREFWVARVEVPNDNDRHLLRRRDSSGKENHWEKVNWVQCCEPTCLKWRKLPVGETAADPKYNKDWFCDENPDSKMALRGHKAPQELDEGELEEREEQKRAKALAAAYMKRKRGDGGGASSAAEAKRRKQEEREEERRRKAEADAEARRAAAEKKEADRQAALERDRQKVEAKRREKEERDRREKEAIREKAKKAKEAAQKREKEKAQKEKEKREKEKEKREAEERRMRDEAAARREQEAAERERQRREVADQQAQEKAAKEKARQEAKAREAAERERRAEERRQREAGDLAIALEKSKKEAARQAAAQAAADAAAAAEADAAADRTAEARQRQQEVDAALAQLEGTLSDDEAPTPDAGGRNQQHAAAAAAAQQRQQNGGAAAQSDGLPVPLPNIAGVSSQDGGTEAQDPGQPVDTDAAEDSDADAQAVVHHFASGDAVAPALSVDYGGGTAMGTRVTAGSGAVAQNGHPAAAAAAADAFATPMPGGAVNSVIEEAEQLTGVVQQLQRQLSTGSTPSTVRKDLARVSRGVQALASAAARSEALAQQMRNMLAALSRAAGDTAEAQRLAALPADELLKLDVQAFAGGFSPTPQRQPARDGWLSIN